MKKRKVIKLMTEDIKESKKYMEYYTDKKFQKGWLAATFYWKKILTEDKKQRAEKIANFLIDYKKTR